MALTKVQTNAIADDAVTTDKLANAINTARDANTAKVGLTDNSVTLAKMAGGTDGQVITYDANGDPVAVGPGTDGQVLTSTGAGSPPAFENAVSEGTQVKSTGESGGTKFLREDGDGTSSWQTIPASGATLSGSTNNTVVTVTGANAMQGESNVNVDGGKLIVGATTSTTEAYEANIQSIGGEALTLGRAATAHQCSEFAMIKTRNATWGNNTIVADDDALGLISFYGDDGTDYKTPAASIIASVDGTPGANDMPGRLAFNTTADGASSTTERIRIDSAGDVTVKTGNLVIGTSGKGIDFSATGNAGGMSSELLDTYEEGTWTPTVDYGTVTVDDARYVKIGQVCHVKCQLTGFSDNSGGYDVNISLPFSAIDIGSGGGNCCFGGVGGRYIDNPGGTGNLAPYVGNNSSNMSIRLTASGNWDGLTYADLQSSSSVLLVGMTYWSD